MVLEKFVVSLLDKYLSNYIENLDYKKLNIDLWSGNVVLENLYLKPNALADFNLPVTVTIGYLKKLTLQIPWRSLFTSPTKLTIDGLYAVVVPKIEIAYNAEQDEKERHEAKMKEVYEIEQLSKEKESLNIANDDSDTFNARIKLQVMQNIELSIHNIHIVYEDKITKPDHPFSIGITLNYITFQTTNKEWTPMIITDNNNSMIYKLGKLNALSLYWNTNTKSKCNGSRTEIIENLQSQIAADHRQAPSELTYILQPLNIQAQLIMTLQPRQQNFEKPMFHITINLEYFSLHINRVQYLDILDILDFQDHMTAKLRYIKYRPKNFDTIKQKWVFAYNAIVNEEIKPRFECYKWKNIKVHLESCREYRYLYKQEVLGKITDQQKKRAESLEKKLDLFNLIYIRRCSQLEAKKEKEQQPKTLVQSFSSWWNKKSNAADSELDLTKALSPEEKKKLYETIGYEGEDTSALAYPKNYVDIDLTFQLNMFDFNIWSRVNENDHQFKIIARAVLPHTKVVFRRRPAASSALFLASLGSFQVYGLATDLQQVESSNATRPVLIHPTVPATEKSAPSDVLQVEFEINPLDKTSQYRVKVLSQSLEIKYNSPTINKLVEYFQNEKQHDLKGVKQMAYTKYIDAKHQSISLMKNNLEKVKLLDIYVDLQSSYFLLPENGVYYTDCSVLCLDMGHLVVQRKAIMDDVDEKTRNNYNQFQLELKRFQLLYATKSENWREARDQETSRLHLIKPITVQINIFQCIYLKNVELADWKIAGQIPAVNIRLSDMRLFNMVQHIQSISFPKSSNIQEISNAPLSIKHAPDVTQQTLQTIESLIPPDESLNEDQVMEQLTQVEANFEISEISLLLEEEDENGNYPFLCISFQSICGRTLVKTFDIEMQLSLDDFVFRHEQFITKDNRHLRFLATDYEEDPSMNKTSSKKLIDIHILHTTSTNPLFNTTKYNAFENRIKIDLNKLIIMLQLEALLSIIKFQENITRKWAKYIPDVKIEPKPAIEKSSSEVEQNTLARSNRVLASNTLEIHANLKEFHIVIARASTQMFDVHIQDVKANVRQTSNETCIDLIIADFGIFDSQSEARFRKIISQQSEGNDLLSISVALFHYPRQHVKALDDVDCSVKLNFSKTNMLVIYKHIDEIMEFLDVLNISRATQELSSHQSSAIYAQLHNLSSQAFKLRLNIILNAPNIIVPVNDYSDEALCLDLGTLTLKTEFIDNAQSSLVEQQRVRIENLLASRIKLSPTNEIESEINLIECSHLNMDIRRLLYPDKFKNKPQISIKTQWDLIHFQLAKNDYLCLIRVLLENFRHQTNEKVALDHKNTERQQLGKQDLSKKADVLTPNDSSTDQILEKVRFHAEIKQLALTLYCDNSDFTTRRIKRNENSQLTKIEIDTVEIDFHQYSNSSYNMKAQIKNFLLDDLRAAHKNDAIVHMINRHFSVDQQIPMLAVSLDFKPQPINRQLVNVDLESLFICVKLDCLIALLDFFKTDLLVDNSRTEKSRNREEATKTSITTTEPANNAIEITMKVQIKNPQIILLEDQQNSKSNCLVLNFALNLNIVNNEDGLVLLSVIKDLSIYGTDLIELKRSKAKYRILQPTKIDLTTVFNPQEQKIDVGISQIILNISPAAIRTLIAVAKSLSQPESKAEPEQFDIRTMFDPKELDQVNFWYLKDANADSSSMEISKPTANTSAYLSQLFILKLETLELKLDVGFGSVTKSVAAICISNWIATFKNWSDEMSGSLSMDIEAALYNQHTLAWEPLIEPVYDTAKTNLLPWNITCSVAPVSTSPDQSEFASAKKRQDKKLTGLDVKQLISIRSYQLLNITITKTGLELIQYLSSTFNDMYQQRSLKSLDTDEPMLSLLNSTGNDIVVDKLNGLQYEDNSTGAFKVMQHGESISFITYRERSSSANRLSVIHEQNYGNRQEFTIQIDNEVKLISINRTWQHIYYLKPSFKSSHPIQLLCDTEIKNNQRRVILSSVVRIYNNTNLPIVVIDFKATGEQSHMRVGSDEYFHLPINLIYKNSQSLIFLGIDGQIKYDLICRHQQRASNADFIAFDWIAQTTQEEKLKVNGERTVHLLIHKETKQAYSENTDELTSASYNIYIHVPVQLTNLLPVTIKCSINNIEQFTINPSQVKLITSGNKNSKLIFTIPSYNDIKWTSDVLDLANLCKNDSNEYFVTFYNDAMPNKSEILQMILHLDRFHDSYRLSLLIPFWIVNRTGLQLDFRIGNSKILIKNSQNAYLVCPEKFKIDSCEKGQIRLHSVVKDDSTKFWSEKFSLDVIKSTGMASCKWNDDKTYTICVDITTSSFGFTRIITLTPALVVINKASLPLEITEILLYKEQNTWTQIECGEVVPFWPQNTKEGSMVVRYAHNHKQSSPFSINKKYQTLLFMDDTDRLVISLEVMATDFDGVRVIFSDYKSGDAPVLIVNQTHDQLISFSQKDHTTTQFLVPKHFVYYTWADPLKPHELNVTCNDKSVSIELSPQRGILYTIDKENSVRFMVFVDSVQMVLLISYDESVFDTALNMPSSTKSICRRLHVGISDIGLSLVNDIVRKELLYISFTKSKILWMQPKRYRAKPFPDHIQTHLEHLYTLYCQSLDKNFSEEYLQTQHQLKDYREVIFHEDTAELISSKGERKLAHRQSIDGLSIEYMWSTTNAAVHVCVNRIQIDNQLDFAQFPITLNPTLLKTSNPDISEKPFIEFSVYQSKASRSNIIHIQYCKLLVQEFAFRIDKSLILAMLAFFKQEKKAMTQTINMNKDLDSINRSLQTMVLLQTDSSMNESRMYFDNIHLSPLKIHVSFSMHTMNGANTDEDLFTEFPLVEFLIRTLNVVEVNDVILRLGFYERSFHQFTTTKLQKEVLAHYQNQFLKQIHVLILGLDVLGNPLGVIRGLAEGVESLFYEPYKGVIEGPWEFAEGMASGVLSFFGATVGTAAGAVSRITGAVGQTLATLTFDEEYKASRIHRRETAGNAVTDIAAGGKNVVKGIFSGVTGIVTKPVTGAMEGGASGFVKGLGKGIIGLVAQPTSGIVDFASSSLDIVKRTTTQEQIVRRVRYPRHIISDGIIRPYAPHEAMGCYILNRIGDGQYSKTDVYVAHITPSENSLSWLMATSKRFLFIIEVSILGIYKIDWKIDYTDLESRPSIVNDRQVIKIPVKKSRGGGIFETKGQTERSVKFRNIDEAQYFMERIMSMMHALNL